MIAWEEMVCVRKGLVGEALVKEFMLKRGYQVYTPDFDGPHICDYFCHHPTERLHFADAKTYSKRDNYPDTGLNLESYEDYCNEEDRPHGHPIYLYWVDQRSAAIYGNWLSILRRPHCRRYPLIENSKNGWKTYFHMSRMVYHCELAPGAIAKLQALTRTNYHNAIDQQARLDF